MKPVRIEPEAVNDLRDAFRWYENQRLGLGNMFLDQFETVQSKISARPASFPILFRQTRRALMRRYPYLVLFVETCDAINIVGVFHAARDPAALRERTDS